MKRMPTIVRTLATLLCGTAILAGAYAPLTAPRANAQLATFDVANFLTNTAQTVIVQTLNGVAWAVAKTAIQSVTKSIVNWVNSGYQGKPAFSQNLNRDMRQVADAVPGYFLSNVYKGIQQARIISPFAADVADITVKAYLLSTSGDYLAERLRYTLLDYTQDSVAFMRGNFSQGGLDAWHALSYNCANDFACAGFITREELIKQIDAETRSWLADYNNGRGFLSWKGECNQYQQTSARNDEAYNSVCSGANYNAEDCAALLNSDSNAGMLDETVALNDADTCLGYDTVTPGSLVEETLGITVNSPLRQLELADSINEIVGAVVTQMVGQVLGGGGLAGLSSPSSGGSRPIDRATTPGSTGTGIAAGFETIAQNELDKAIEYRTAWSDILTLAQEARRTCSIAGAGISRSIDLERIERQATTAIARADKAIEGLNTVLESFTDSAEPALFGSAAAGASQRAWDAYQRLLASNTLITAQEQADATAARDESDSDSIYSRVSGYVDACD